MHKQAKLLYSQKKPTKAIVSIQFVNWGSRLTQIMSRMSRKAPNFLYFQVCNFFPFSSTDLTKYIDSSK